MLRRLTLQTGGNFGSPKIDLAGCVFYAPLWRPDLAGATFYSKDSSPKLFTPTNATWGYQGRTFAGNGDITAAVADFRSTDSLGTINVWFKTTVGGYIFSSADVLSNIYWIGIAADVGAGSGLRMVQTNDDIADSIRGDTTPIDDGLWHMGTVVSDGTAYIIYTDTILQNITIAGGANTGDWFADTPNMDNISMGTIMRLSVAGYFTGTIGEVLIFSRALSAGEIMRLYQDTKWRYS